MPDNENRSLRDNFTGASFFNPDIERQEVDLAQAIIDLHRFCACPARVGHGLWQQGGRHMDQSAPAQASSLTYRPRRAPVRPGVEMKRAGSRHSAQ